MASTGHGGKITWSTLVWLQTSPLCSHWLQGEWDMLPFQSYCCEESDSYTDCWQWIRPSLELGNFHVCPPCPLSRLHSNCCWQRGSNVSWMKSYQNVNPWLVGGFNSSNNILVNLMIFSQVVTGEQFISLYLKPTKFENVINSMMWVKEYFLMQKLTKVGAFIAFPSLPVISPEIRCLDGMFFSRFFCIRWLR